MSSKNSGMFGFGAIGQSAIGESDYQGAGDNPPPRLGGPIALIALAVAIAQPDPWQYVFEGGGGRQPYAAPRMAAAILAVAADQPPIIVGGPYASKAEIVAIAQPDPWAYVYLGPQQGGQPYAPRNLNPTVTAVQVDMPPRAGVRWAPFAAEIAAIAQPDPWVYNFQRGARQPYAAGLLPPSFLAVTVDAPIFGRRPAEHYAELVAIAQPATWTYTFAGGAQPYAPTKRLLGVPGFSVEAPPRHMRDMVALSEAAAIAQPDPWVYLFNGAAQPYAPAHRLAGTPGFSIEPPPPKPNAQTLAEIISLAQPATWTYTFTGGPQPYAGVQLSPLIEGVPVPIPGAGKKYTHTPYLPEPAYEVKPQKPFRPVWDLGGEVEQPETAAPRAVPLPPTSIFGTPAPTQQSTLNTGALPQFDQFVPPDPIGLRDRMQEAIDLSDAEAVLKALGLMG